MYSVLFAKFEKKRISRRKKFKDQIAVIFRISKLEFERIRGKKLDFHRLFRLIGFLRRPLETEGLLLHVSYMIRIAFSRGKGRVGSPSHSRNSLWKSRYDTIVNEKLSSTLNWFRWLIGSKSNRWYKQVNLSNRRSYVSSLSFNQAKKKKKEKKKRVKTAIS